MTYSCYYPWSLGWGNDIYFTFLSYNPIILYLFCCSNFSALITGFQLTPVSPRDTSINGVVSCFCFSSTTFLLSGTTWCFRFILHISCPSPRICHFSKQPWFLSLKNGIRNRHLGTRCVLTVSKFIFLERIKMSMDFLFYSKWKLLIQNCYHWARRTNIYFKNLLFTLLGKVFSFCSLRM